MLIKETCHLWVARFCIYLFYEKLFSILLSAICPMWLYNDIIRTLYDIHCNRIVFIAEVL